MPQILIPDNRIIPARARAGGGFEAAANLPAPAWVAGQEPVISSVFGSFAEGSTVTIAGSNFSSKRRGQLAFINFEGETLGELVTSVAQDASGPQYVATDTDPLFGSIYARCHAIQESLGTAAVLLGQEYQELFFEGWTRYSAPDFDDPSDAQIKFWRMVPGLTLGETAQNRSPTIVSISEQGNGFTVSAHPEEYIAGIWYGGGAPPQNVWEPWTLFLKIGDPNVANGKRYAKIGDKVNFTYSSSGHFASPNDVVPASAWDGEDIITNDGSLEGGLGRLFLPYYTRSAQETISEVDRIYLNDSPERVCVGDASTWAACTRTKTFILKQLDRQTDQIDIEVDALGPLATGPAYLYVFNQDGKFNTNGFLWRES